jgi:hypothetical protein
MYKHQWHIQHDQEPDLWLEHSLHDKVAPSLSPVSYQQFQRWVHDGMVHLLYDSPMQSDIIILDDTMATQSEPIMLLDIKLVQAVLHDGHHILHMGNLIHVIDIWTDQQLKQMKVSIQDM